MFAACLWIVWWLVISTTESAFARKRLNCRNPIDFQSRFAMLWNAQRPQLSDAISYQARMYRCICDRRHHTMMSNTKTKAKTARAWRIWKHIYHMRCDLVEGFEEIVTLVWHFVFWLNRLGQLRILVWTTRDKPLHATRSTDTDRQQHTTLGWYQWSCGVTNGFVFLFTFDTQIYISKYNVFHIFIFSGLEGTFDWMQHMEVNGCHKD